MRWVCVREKYGSAETRAQGTAGTGSSHEISALCEGRRSRGAGGVGGSGRGGGVSPAALDGAGAALGNSGHPSASRGRLGPGLPPLSRDGGGGTGTDGAEPRPRSERRGRAARPSRGPGPGSGRSPGEPLRSGERRGKMSGAGGLKHRVRGCAGVCVCGGDALQRLPVPLPPPHPGSRRDRAPPGAGAGCRGTDPCPPSSSSPPPNHLLGYILLLPFLLRHPKSGRRQLCGAEPGFGSPTAGGGGGGSGAPGWGVPVSPPGRWVKPAGPGSDPPGAPRQRSRAQ